MATIFAVSGCDQTKGISINVNKGDKYVSDISTNADTSMKLGQQTIDSKQKMDMNYVISITDVDKDNNITMNYKYNSIKVDTEANGQTSSYNSKDTSDSSSEAGQIYGGFIGKSFSVKVNNKGKILEVKGIDSILNSVVDKINTSDGQKDKIKSTLEESFGDNAIKSALQQSMNYYPSKKVNVGDTWDNKYNLNMMFPMSISSKYKLASADNDKYTINVKSNLVADTKDKASDIMGVQAKVKLNGDMTGNINIDKDNGFLNNGTLKETVKGNMDMLPSDEIPTEMNVPITITENVTYKTTKQ
ncbi:MAG: DUF6263 family protein [Clostridium sp.]|nr:DUF6263 family protein [Clostridium sp.]